jgi:hypothetical protein
MNSDKELGSHALKSPLSRTKMHADKAVHLQGRSAGRQAGRVFVYTKIEKIQVWVPGTNQIRSACLA